MTQTDQAQSNYIDQFQKLEHSRASADPSWLRDVRKDGLSNFQRMGFPVARRGNEQWKYTNVAPIATGVFDLAQGAPVPQFDASVYELPCPRVHQLVFVDGRYEPTLSTEPHSEAALSADVIGHRGDGAVVGRLADAIEYRVPLVQEHLGRLVSAELTGFSALNTAFIRDGAFVHIPDSVLVPEPIYLLFVSTGQREIVSHPRVLVIAGEGASATILESYENLGNSTGCYFTNGVTEIVAGQGSNLRLYKLQREGSGAYHVNATRIEQADNSTVASVTVDLGGSLVRRDLDTALAGSGASARVFGLYHGTGTQHVDNHTFIDHAVPETSSNEVFKGVLEDSSHGVFVGRVLVRPSAQQTSAHQVNKNLLLSESAEVDTQPKLEIFADDVSCTHGAAVGQLDAEAMFYLNSRGIGSELARRLLLQGFVKEVLDAVEDDAVRQYLESAVASRFGQGD